MELINPQSPDYNRYLDYCLASNIQNREMMPVIQTYHKFKNIEPIVVPIRDFSYIDDSHLLTYAIEELNKRGWDTPIVHNTFTEPYMVKSLKFIDELKKYLYTNYNYNPNNIYYLISNVQCKRNNELLKKTCDELNIEVPKNIIYSDFFEYVVNKPPHNFLKHFPRLSKFLCFNRVLRGHRMAIISEIIERDLLDKCYLSAITARSDTTVADMYYGLLKKGFPNMHSKIIKNMEEKIKPLMPLDLTMKSYSNRPDHVYSVNTNDAELFQSSLFSLVNETNFITNVSPCDPDILEEQHCFGIFPTEKTFKPMKMMQPFIVVTAPHFLEFLREKGYKTFSPYIDETYDTIEDDESRLLAIMDEVERLMKMTKPEIRQWIKDLTPVLHYNKILLSQHTTHIISD